MAKITAGAVNRPDKRDGFGISGETVPMNGTALEEREMTRGVFDNVDDI